MTVPPPTPLVRRVVPALAFIVFALVAFQQVAGNNDQDFLIYRAGAAVGLRGESPYRPGSVRSAVKAQYPADTRLADNCGFFLAPPALAVFAPFAALPWTLAKCAWAGVTILAGGVAAFRLRGLFLPPCEVERTSGSWPAVLVPAAVLLNPVALLSLVIGQTTVPVVGCVAAGQLAFRGGRPALGAVLWAVPFVKPHLALPLLPLAWALGGWRRAAAVALAAGGLTLAGCLVSTGSPTLLFDYVDFLRAGHKAVEFNRVELNPQITSWNRALVALHGPVIELSAGTTLAGYAVWLALVAGRGLRSRRPDGRDAWLLACAAVGAVLCCQLLAYELGLLALVAPHAVALARAGRAREVTAFVAVFAAVSLPFEPAQWVIEAGVLPRRAADAVESFRCFGVLGLAGLLIAGGPVRTSTSAASSP